MLIGEEGFLGRLCVFDRVHLEQLRAHVESKPQQEFHVAGPEGEIVCLTPAQIHAAIGLLERHGTPSCSVVVGNDTYVALFDKDAGRRLWSLADLVASGKRKLTA